MLQTACLFLQPHLSMWNLYCRGNVRGKGEIWFLWRCSQACHLSLCLKKYVFISDCNQSLCRLFSALKPTHIRLLSIAAAAPVAFYSLGCDGKIRVDMLTSLPFLAQSCENCWHINNGFNTPCWNVGVAFK